MSGWMIPELKDSQAYFEWALSLGDLEKTYRDGQTGQDVPAIAPVISNINQMLSWIVAHPLWDDVVFRDIGQITGRIRDELTRRIKEADSKNSLMERLAIMYSAAQMVQNDFQDIRQELKLREHLMMTSYPALYATMDALEKACQELRRLSKARNLSVLHFMDMFKGDMSQEGRVDELLKDLMNLRNHLSKASAKALHEEEEINEILSRAEETLSDAHDDMEFEDALEIAQFLEQPLQDLIKKLEIYVENVSEQMQR